MLQAVGRFAARLGVVALVAGAIVWWALWIGLGTDQDRGTLLIVAAVLLLAPPTVLLFVFWVVREVAEIPARIREAPTAVRGRVEDIRRRAGQAAEARHQGTVRRMTALFRLWRAVATLREEVGALSPLVVGPGSLLAGVVAGAFAIVEIGAGLVALLWLALR
jgi:hypothetical protein